MDKYTKNKAKGGFNKIYYGAPGCGKSYKLKKDLKSIYVDDKNIDNKNDEPINKIYSILKETPELNAYEYDGSYQCVKDTIKEYKKTANLKSFTVDDMNFIYSIVVGSWKMSIDVRKNRLKQTNLSEESKDNILNTINETWNKSVRREYIHHSYKKQTAVGIFGTGFMSFSGKLSDQDANKFIKMCTEIVDIDDENEIYNICSRTINKQFVGRGLGAASASAILHCLNPYVFPVLNSNEGQGTIYELLGIKLNNPKKLNTYIDNCRAITDYRNKNFNFKNYRILDVAIWCIVENNYDLQGMIKDKYFPK